MISVVIVFYVLAVAMVLPMSFSIAPPPATQISALQDFYVQLNGYNWTWIYPTSTYGQVWNFTGDNVNPCDDWQGVTCTTNSSISKIQLSSNGIAGQIPSTIQQLTDLQLLYITYTELSGTIPLAFCNMSSLINIFLGNGLLYGSIPPCLTTHNSLKTLSLHINSLTGHVPAFTPTSGSKITYLSLSGNMLTGEVPSSLSYLKKLTTFYLSYNLLSGTSLDFINDMSSLRYFSIANNQFYATIPTSASLFEQMEYWYMESNYLYGSLPEYGESVTSNIIYFSVYSNLLSGSIPSSMSTWTNIVLLAIDGNQLTGPVSSSIVQNWGSLEQFTLYQNVFTGKLPTALTANSNLQVLLLQNNVFSGNPGIAFDRTTQISLNTLDISSNFFTGTIPDQIFGGNLTTFIAFETCFHGSIPSSICESTRLTTLSLDGITSYCSKAVWPGIPGSPRQARRISGTIPSCIWTDLVNITTLQISGNGLSGTIPSLSAYGNLSYLDLSYNSLNGTIPFVLQSLHTMKYLNLESNKFVGDITGVGLLPYSQVDQAVSTTLRLANNRLSGIIPPTLESSRNIFIVEGNLFSCSGKHPPPLFDSDRDNFVCGSNLLDMSLWLFLACSSFIVLILVIFAIVSYDVSRKLLEIGNAMKRFVFALSDRTVLLRWQADLTIAASRASTSYSKSSLQMALGVVSCFLWKAQVNMIRGSIPCKVEVPNLVQFLLSLRSMRHLIVVLMLLLVILGLPTYAGLKMAFATFTFQYQWHFSGVFLSGISPALALLLLWMVVLLTAVVWIKYSIPRSITYFPKSTDMVKESDDYLSDLDSVVDDEDGSQKARARGTLGAATLAPSLGSGGLSNSSLARYTIATVKTAVKKVQKKSLWISIAALVANAMVVALMKAGFIYLLVGSNTTFGFKVLIELSLATVDVGWTTTLVPFFISNLPKKRSQSRMMLKAFMLFFNSVIAPCAVIAVTDSSCFNGLFVPENTVQEEFTFDYCNIFSSSNPESCADAATFQSSSTYTPVFFYNYNCYSTIVVEYIPIFLLSYSSVSILLPAVTLWLMTRRHKSTILDMFPGVYFLPLYENNHSQFLELGQSKEKEKGMSEVKNVLYDGDSECASEGSADKAPQSESDVSSISTTSGPPMLPNRAVSAQSITNREVLYPQFILASVIHHLVVMLTFAVIYPPLSVAIAMLTLVTTYTWEILIGRWTLQDSSALSGVLPSSNDSIASSASVLSLSRESGVSPTESFSVGPFTRKLDILCIDVCCGPTKWYGLLSFGSAIFFSFIAIDMAGDSIGWSSALWMLIISLGIALVIYVFGSIDCTRESWHERGVRISELGTTLIDRTSRMSLTFNAKAQESDDDRPSVQMTERGSTPQEVVTTTVS